MTEKKLDPFPPSSDHPSVFGICVELQKFADVKDEEASDLSPANQDSVPYDSETLLRDKEEAENCGEQINIYLG